MIIGLALRGNEVTVGNAEGRDLSHQYGEVTSLAEAVEMIVANHQPDAVAVVVDDDLDSDGREALIKSLTDVSAGVRVVAVPSSMADVHAGDGAQAVGAAKVTASAGWQPTAQSRPAPEPADRKSADSTEVVSVRRFVRWPFAVVLVAFVLLAVVVLAL